MYFIINKLTENYLSTQENFDPSLIPVSSIVTLAKVAQKLVDGNGTLTNPGNLQIGASTATPGNLTVNGGAKINGNIGTTPMPEVTADRNMNVVMNNTLTADRITMGKYTNDNNYDVIRSGAPSGLLLTAANNQVTVWGNNLQVDRNLTSSGSSKLNGGAIITGNNGLTQIPELNNGESMSSTLTADRITMGKYTADDKIDVIRSGAPGGLFLNSASNKVNIWKNNLDVGRDLNVFGNSNITGTSTLSMGIIINGNTGTIPLPIINQSSSMNNTLNADRITMGRSSFSNYDENHDIIHSSAPGSLILSSANGLIRLRGKNNLQVDGTISVSTGLDAFGELNVYNKINYTGMGNTSMPVGCFKIRYNSYQVPLYYGWNIMWDNNTDSEKLRTSIKWNNLTDERFFHYAGIDMRSGVDKIINNWTPRYISVMPGYKFRFYLGTNTPGLYNTIGNVIDNSGEYPNEMNFPDNVYEGKSVYFISVRYKTDNWLLPQKIQL